MTAAITSLTATILTLALMLAGCGNSEKPKKEPKPTPEVEAPTCTMNQWSLTVQGSKRTFNISRENGAITHIVNTMDDGKSRTFVYETGANGMPILTSDTTRNLSIEHVYDESGRIKAQYGTGGDTIRFIHDDAGLLVRQEFTKLGNPHRTQEINYDEAGRAIHSKVFDRYGNHQVDYYFEYDNAHNPWKHLSALVSNFERSYNYAVGNGPNNVTQIILQFQQKSNSNLGQTNLPGQTDTINFDYTYNEAGYPTRIDMKRRHYVNVFEMAYDCE